LETAWRSQSKWSSTVGGDLN